MIGLLALALAAAPPDPTPRAQQVAVLVVRRTSVTPDEARAFADATVAALRAAKVAVEEPAESLRRLSVLGVSDPTVCSGRKACVLELARQLEVGAIVAISAAALQSERSVVFEATRAADGVAVAKDAAVIKAGTALQPDHLKAVVSALAAAFPAAAVVAEPKVDAPVVEKKVTPPPVEEKKVIVDATPPPPQRSHTVTWVTAALAIAAGVTSVALGVTGSSARAQLLSTMPVNGQMVSMLSGSQANALASQANVFGAIAAVAAVFAVALGLVAVVSW